MEFYSKIKTIKDVDQKVMISLDPKVIEYIFKVPHKVECADLTKESSLACWNGHQGDY